MQPVSLYDEILLEVGDGKGIFIECDNRSVPSDETNLVYRAAKAFFEATGINRHLFIKIKKNIPVAAGLGGGSSNAAKVLAIYRAGRGGNQQVLKGFVMNDLEAVAIKKYPEIKEIKDTLINSGAIGALMSGSGATAFGIFLDEHEAIRAFELLKREQKTRGWAFFLVQGL